MNKSLQVRCPRVQDMANDDNHDVEIIERCIMATHNHNTIKPPGLRGSELFQGVQVTALNNIPRLNL